jgi:hypothetical protein
MEETEVEEKPPARKRFRNPSLLQSTELRNFLPSVTVTVNQQGNMSPVSIEGVVDTDDQLSLCASDQEESEADKSKETVIQCNVVSSCFPKDENNTHTTHKVNLNTNTKKPNGLVSDLPKSPVHNLDQDETIKKQDTIIDNYTKTDIVVDNQQPGPSGYSQMKIQTDSDSSSSVVVVDAPEAKGSRILSLITDSDSDENAITLSNGKHRAKKTKKKRKLRTVKEKLSKQEGIKDGERQDLQDLNCSVCLGPFENRTFLKECFHILF